MIWYVAQNGQAQKMSEEVLLYKIENDEISPDTLVVNPDIKNWIPLNQTQLWQNYVKIENDIEEAGNIHSFSHSSNLHHWKYPGSSIQYSQTISQSNHSNRIKSSNDQQPVVQTTPVQMKKRILAIIGLFLGLLGGLCIVLGFLQPILFVFSLSSIVCLVFGIITLVANPLTWEYQGDVRGLSWACIFIGSIGLFLMLLVAFLILRMMRFVG